jgi:hypothetical protein
VIIQREAIRLSHDPLFFERYDVPEEVRKCLGPRSRTLRPVPGPTTGYAR